MCRQVYSTEDVLSIDGPRQTSDVKTLLMSEPLEEGRKQHRAESENQTKRRHLADSAIFPKLPDDHRYDLRSRTVQQQRHRQLTNSNEKDVDPAGEKRGKHKGKQNFPYRLSPVAAAGRRTFLEFPMDT